MREDEDELLAEWLAEIAARLQRGEVVNLSRYETQAPELVGELRALLPNMEMLAALPEDHPVAPAQRGDFEIVREIGRGGIGVVYEAVQRPLRRRVALKALLPWLAPDAHHLRRFQTEALVAGVLDHPHIVPVYAYGSDDVGPFYVMPFIDGRDGARIVSELRNEQKSTLRRTGSAHARFVARLAIQAADALAHAHARGVLHRDIKPSNLLVDSNGHLWVTDFGLARMRDEIAHSVTSSAGGFVGTLRYASAEQLFGRREELDGRTDIYALGVTLYELLTLQPAFAADNSLELMRQIADDPARPRQINPAIPADLERIVLKAMARAPADRYASARDLAADLKRFLDGGRILASPPSVTARFVRWIARHRLMAVSATLGAIAAAVVALWTWDDTVGRERQHEQLARRNSFLARQVFVPRLREASRMLQSRQVTRCRELIRAIEMGAEGYDPGEFAWNYVRSRADRALVPISTGLERWDEAWPSPDGSALLVVGSRAFEAKTPIHVLDRFTLRRRTTITATGLIAAPSSLVRFSPDGQLVYCTERQSTRRDPHRLWAWELATGKLRAELKLDPGWSWLSVFPLAGERVLVVTYPDPAVAAFSLWELSADRPAPRLVTEVVASQGSRCFPSGDGRTLAVTNADGLAGRVRLFDVLTASFRKTPETLLTRGGIVAALLSHDGTILVTGDDRGEIVFWDVATGRELSRHGLEHAARFSEFDVSPDGTTATAFDPAAGVATFWQRDRAGTHTIGPAELQGRLVRHPRFSPDGARFATVTQTPSGKLFAVWDTRTGAVVAKLADALRADGEMRFTPDGHELCIGSRASALLWRIDDCAPTRLAGHGGGAFAIACSPDGRTLASGSDDTEGAQTIKLWDAATGAQVDGWFAGLGTVSQLAFSPDGRTLASSHLARKDNVRLWDVTTGKSLATLSGHTLPAHSVAFSPDGSLLASCDGAVAEPVSGTIRLWDARTRMPGTALNGHTRGVRALAFSPDGTLLASRGDDGARVWEVATRRQRALFPNATTGTVSFCADGDTLAFSPEPACVRLQGLSMYEARAVLKCDAGELLELAFAPDGSAVAAAGKSGIVRLFDVLTGEELLRLEGHTSRVHGLAFSPDGSTLASCSHDGAVLLWRAVPALAGP